MFLDLVLGVFLLTAESSGVPQPGIALDARYETCLRQVDIDPRAAASAASSWAQSGGGVPARHCEALAMIALERFEDAGDILVGLGFDESVDIDLRANLLGQAGNAYLLARRAEKAVKAFDGAIALNPADADLLIDRARAHAMQAHWDLAIADLDAAIALVPIRAHPYVLRASAKRQKGDAYGAKTDIELALQREPENVDALVERGLLRAQTGDAAGAREDFERVLAQLPNSTAAEVAKAELAKLP